MSVLRQIVNPLSQTYLQRGICVIEFIKKDSGERDKMRVLSSILAHFRSELNTFKDAWARLLDSIPQKY